MSKSNNVREVVELFCKIIQENNVSLIRAEVLRQAKFNNCTAVFLGVSFIYCELDEYKCVICCWITLVFTIYIF